MKLFIFTALMFAALPALSAPVAPAAYLAGPDLSSPLALPELPLPTNVVSDNGSVDSARLAAARGREGSTTNATLGGIVSGNSATHVSTGANMITDGAFANMTGLPVVIQNSGANVLIQNATVINLQFR